MPMPSLPVCAVQRVVPLGPQMAEQLVEVPTPSYIFEQNVDSPVPRGRGGCRLQGFLPGQSSSSSGVIPRVLSGTPGQSLVQRTVVQTVDIPAPFGGPPLRGFHTVFQVFTLDRVHQRLLSSSLMMEIFKVFTLDRVFHSVLPRRTLTSLFRKAVLPHGMEVFTVLLQDRVQELAVELEFVMVFRALSQDRVQQLFVGLSSSGRSMSREWRGLACPHRCLGAISCSRGRALRRWQVFSGFGASLAGFPSIVVWPKMASWLV